jgi:outer membrane protein assembly factor BamB
MRLVTILSALLFIAAGWPTESHDVRRTSQSDVRGPRSVARVDSIALDGEQSINMPVTVANDGTLFAGTWGLVHTRGSNDPRAWDKFDGKLFALHRNLTSRWTATLDHVPYCYAYADRQHASCPPGTTLHGYNGTVEGVTTIDAQRQRVYVGRGDGKLYALDLATGAIVWRFNTFNPLAPSDPDGGGEVIAGPLLAPNGTIYIGTAAAGDYETNAIYAISPEGALLWRYPASEASMPNVIWAAPALSPDGETVYVGGGWGPTVGNRNDAIEGGIYAFDAATGAVKWIFHPKNDAEWWKPTIWTEHLAVGTDGTIYAAGTEYTLGGGSAVLFALRDLGTSATYAWPRMIDIDRGRARFAEGIALRETGGQTRRVYATSGNPFIGAGYIRGGTLVAVDATSGTLLWTFDPESHGGIGSMTGIAIDTDGVIYTGVSGATNGGRVYAIRENGSLLWQYPLGGLLEWAHPVIGPQGDLYVAETRRCILNAFPVETGACGNLDVNPRVYAIRSATPSKRRAVR